MHPKLRSLICLGGWAVGLASGCDDQVAPGYFGESLLTVRGSVTISNSHAMGALSPALAFDRGATITIVDVPVQGTFPSDFRIEMYEPPPESTLHHPTMNEEGEPLVAVSYITAVTSDLPKKLYVGNSLTLTVMFCKDEGRPDNLCLQQVEETCPEPNTDNVPCYVEKRYCPMGDRDPNDTRGCIIEKSGDPALTLSDVGDRFAGLSENYQVVYFAEAAAPGSATAAWFGATEDGVPAGYGLYEVRYFMNDEICSFDDPRVLKLAARYYNEAHGTDYKTLACNGQTFDAPFCTMPSDDFEGRNGPAGEVRRLTEKANVELGCPISYSHYKRVDDPANTPISIVIDGEKSTEMEPPVEP